MALITNICQEGGFQCIT